MIVLSAAHEDSFENRGLFGRFTLVLHAGPG